jgi:hypothetical protein
MLSKITAVMYKKIWNKQECLSLQAFPARSIICVQGQEPTFE